ncbi:MAG: hypothetical protein ABJB97_11635, partial [Acidobacteriota bacterium]
QGAIEAAKKRLRSDQLVFATCAALIIVGAIVFSAVAVARPMMESDVFEPELEHLNWATIPSTAPDDPTDLPDDVPQAELALDNGVVEVKEWKPEHRVINVELTDDDELLVRTFTFPGWTATVDDNQVPIKSSEDLADMEIELTAGKHRVTLDFLETPPRRTFRIVTLCSFGVLIVLGCGGLVPSSRTGANKADG